MKSEHLIIDFPRTRRCHARPCGTNKKKELRFSTSSRLHIFEHQDVEASEVWYSDRDVKLMKVANRKAAMEVSARLSSRSSNGSITVTGLERLLTPKTLKKSYAVRQAVRAAVLEEQERQYRQGEEVDPIKIRSVAARYSAWSTKKAHTIALYTTNSLGKCDS